MLLSPRNLRAARDSFRAIPAPEPEPVRPARGLGGRRARVSVDRPGESMLQAAMSLAGPLTPNEDWRALDLDSATLDRISTADLLELLADVSPDVSRALWDFLRICNPGHTAEVLRPSGARAPQAAQAALGAILDTIAAQHGDLTVAIGRLFLGAFMRGGLLAELILDQTGRQTLGLATPDPASLTWRRCADPDLGIRWEVGQQQAGGQFVSLERPTIVYIPIDPLPGRPEGRSPANPAIFPTLFALAMLHDVRRVIQQQGWPRLDLEIDMAQIPPPPTAPPGSKEYQDWIDKTVDIVAGYYEGLQPDDAYVHTSAVKVNRPVGAADASSLGAVPALIQVLERQAVRALKTAPLLMGITDGVSEANANRQIDLYLMTVRSMQHLAENLLERLLTVALQAQGVAGVVRWRFAEAQGLQRLRDAQVQQIEAANAWNAYQYGWIDHATAAKRGAGVDTPAADTPLIGVGAQAAAINQPAADAAPQRGQP